MKKFEYKTIKVDSTGWFGGGVDENEFQRFLNLQGAQGWELVSCFTTSSSHSPATKFILAVMKREIE